MSKQMKYKGGYDCARPADLKDLHELLCEFFNLDHEYTDEMRDVCHKVSMAYIGSVSRRDITPDDIDTTPEELANMTGLERFQLGTRKIEMIESKTAAPADGLPCQIDVIYDLKFLAQIENLDFDNAWGQFLVRNTVRDDIPKLRKEFIHYYTTFIQTLPNIRIGLRNSVKRFGRATTRERYKNLYLSTQGTVFSLAVLRVMKDYDLQPKRGENAEI